MTDAELVEKLAITYEDDGHWNSLCEAERRHAVAEMQRVLPIIRSHRDALIAAAYAACANNCLNSAHALEQLVAENPEDAERFREAITWLKAKYLHLNALTPADAAWELERRALEAVLGEATWWKQFSPNAWEAALTERVREYEKRLASLSKPAPVERSNEND